MKLSKLLIIAASALFFTACSTDEEGPCARHELVFKMSMGNHETRSTAEGSWNEGDIVAVRVGTTVKKYVISNPDGMLCGSNAYNTFYWEDLKVSSVEVTAWSLGKKYISSLSNGVSIESDQSVEQKYLNSDFLYAPTTTVNKGDDLSVLSFYHQMARVNINIKCDEAAEIESVVIGDLENASSCFVQADYTEPAAGSGGTVTSYGTFDIDYDNTQAVIPYKTTAAQGFDASYSAILIPIDYESFGISITLTDGSQFYYIGGIYEYNEDGPNPFDPGTVNTFNITIKNKELTVDGHFDAATGQTSDPVSVNNWRIHQ